MSFEALEDKQDFISVKTTETWFYELVDPYDLKLFKVVFRKIGET